MKYIIGIDEVGRGPLAGPVTVAALAILPNLKLPTSDFQLKLRDSKKLSAVQREKWFDFIRSNNRIFYAVSSVYPKVIDRMNITVAANHAASRALQKLLNHPIFDSQCQKVDIFLDYGLKPSFPRALSTFNMRIKTLVHADEVIPAVSLASIAAKVSRDRYMTRQHKDHPEYGFRENKGYGTKKHIQAIQKYGPSSLHRLTFIKNYPILK
jgi:ribonuclease HII